MTDESAPAWRGWPKRSEGLSSDSEDTTPAASTKNQKGSPLGGPFLFSAAVTAEPALDAEEECAAFPALLRLYDEHAETVSRRHLDTWGILLNPLPEGGFLVRRGRHSSIEVALENGETQLVTVQSSPAIGHVRYEFPVSRQWVEIPAQSLDYLEIKREWIEERIIKGLKCSLKPVGQMLQEQGLIFLGVLDLDGESIPVYLARQLSDQRVIRDYDIQLRAHQNAGIGVVLACCETAPAFLGCHAVLAHEQDQFATEITQAEATELLRKNVRIAERAVLRLISVPLADGKFDALASFTFNLGAGALQRSTLRRKVNRGEHKTVPAELMKWVWAVGKELLGLVRRRQAEGVAYASEPSAGKKIDKDSVGEAQTG